MLPRIEELSTRIKGNLPKLEVHGAITVQMHALVVAQLQTVDTQPGGRTTTSPWRGAGIAPASVLACKQSGLATATGGTGHLASPLDVRDFGNARLGRPLPVKGLVAS